MPSSEPHSNPRNLSWLRGFVLGYLCCPVAAYATVNLPQSSMYSLLAIPVGILIFFAAIHALWKLLTKRSFLTPADFAVIYGIVSMASVISAEWVLYSYATVHQLPFLADGNPTVKDVILPNLPDWLAIKELEPIRSMVVGGFDYAYVFAKLPLFLPRWLAWATLFLSVAFACMCVNSLMRGLWTDREKLAFPIIQLPLALSKPADPIWKSKALWISFTVMISIDLLNGLNYWYPNVPKIPVKQLLDLSPMLQSAPWSAMGELPIGIYPFLAAIGLLMPSDLLFSAILFFLIRKVTQIGIASFGVPQSTFSGTYFSPGPPFWEQQAWGAVIAMLVAAIYFSRGYLKEAWIDVRKGKKASDGGPSHRAAFIGLVLCAGAFLWFGMAGGMSVWLILAFFVAFLGFSIVLTRMRAQLGPPTHEFAYFGPTGLLGQFGALQGMGDKQMVWMTQVMLFMNRISRTHPMPTHLEALKLGSETGVNVKRLSYGLAGAAVIGILFAYFFSVTRSYRLGSPIGGTDGIGLLQGMLAKKPEFSPVGVGMIGAGFGVSTLLDFLRVRISGFPLHPVGYLLGITYGIDYYWFGLLIALSIKAFVHRYSGMSGYERLKFIAIGIMLGEYTGEAIWMAIALITKQSTYTIGFNDRSLGVQ